MFDGNAQHTSNNSYEHILTATNISQLQTLWTASTGGNNDYSVPAVVGGMVYVGSNDGKVYALDAITGQQKWAASVGGRLDSSPAVVNGVVYVNSSNGNVYALDAATGQQKWFVFLPGSQQDTGGGDTLLSSSVQWGRLCECN